MALEMHQSQRTEQRMLLTPQMQQAIRLLHLPLFKLEAEIKDELDQNPALEIKAEEVKPAGETDPNSEEERFEDRGPLGDEDFNFREEFDRLLDRERDLDEQYRNTRKYRRDQALDEETRDFWENSLTRVETLDDHLLHQLQMTGLDPENLRIGEEIIGELDHNGYLKASTEEIAQRLGEKETQVERILAVIQHFDPPGIAARDLRECLLSQLNSRPAPSRLIRAIISEHLDDLARKDYSGIARSLGTDPESVSRAAEFISSLEPNPGRDFSDVRIEYITPEIHVYKNDGQYKVYFDHDTLPELRISRNYRNLLEKENLDEETRKYIRERIHSGQWLIDNIRQRQETLRLLAEEIVRRQHDFLEHGPLHIKPMKMSEVADSIGRHESTVSRATAGKYMSTPRGVFPLRSFFGSSLSGSDGEEVSSRKVREMLKKIIRDEDPRHPLSDQKIVEVFRLEGITLARRTVAKYRDQLNIPSTRQRRIR